MEHHELAHAQAIPYTLDATEVEGQDSEQNCELDGEGALVYVLVKDFAYIYIEYQVSDAESVLHC